MAKLKTDRSARLGRWNRDIIAFIREALIDPETSAPYVLYPAQERFLRELFMWRPTALATRIAATNSGKVSGELPSPAD